MDIDEESGVEGGAEGASIGEAVVVVLAGVLAWIPLAAFAVGMAEVPEFVHAGVVHFIDLFESFGQRIGCHVGCTPPAYAVMVALVVAWGGESVAFAVHAFRSGHVESYWLGFLAAGVLFPIFLPVVLPAYWAANVYVPYRDRRELSEIDGAVDPPPSEGAGAEDDRERDYIEL